MDLFFTYNNPVKILQLWLLLILPNTYVLYGVSANDSTESSFMILLIAGYLEK